MNTLKIHDAFLKQHRAFENKALRILLTEFRKLFKEIKFDNLTPSTAEAVILLNINEERLTKMMYKIHYTIGMQYGLSVARQLRADNPLQQKRWKPLSFFSQIFQTFLGNFYTREGGKNIKTLSETVAKQVVEAIKQGTKENETIVEMRKRIQKTVNNPDFYKWQALRIARTETTFAMNAAKEIAGDTSGVLMEKIWIGKNDGRERPSHIALNGVKVGQNDKFSVGADKMKFPGDRESGSAREVINCRCTFGYVAKRDENGRLIFTDSQNIASSYLNNDLPDVVKNNIEKYEKIDSELKSLKNNLAIAEKERQIAAGKVNDYYSVFKKKNPKMKFDEMKRILDADEAYQSLSKTASLLNLEPNRLNLIIKNIESGILEDGVSQYKYLISQLNGESTVILRGGGGMIDDVFSDFKKISKGHNEGEELLFKNTKDIRAYFNQIDKSININSKTDKYSAMHEFAHSLELNEKIMADAVSFYERRTAGKELRKMKEINLFYSDNEFYKDGGFVHPYIGKIYEHKDGFNVNYKGYAATEVISMGVEHMMRNPAYFYARDKEHFELIYNLFFRPR